MLQNKNFFFSQIRQILQNRIVDFYIDDHFLKITLHPKGLQYPQKIENLFHMYYCIDTFLAYTVNTRTDVKGKHSITTSENIHLPSYSQFREVYVIFRNPSDKIFSPLI